MLLGLLLKVSPRILVGPFRNTCGDASRNPFRFPFGKHFGNSKDFLEESPSEFLEESLSESLPVGILLGMPLGIP